MQKFKAGDRVKAITDYPDTKCKRVSVGDTGTVIKIDEELLIVKFDKLKDEEYMYPYRFELANETKEQTSNWLKSNSWYIKTGSPEKSALVQKWLFEHGFEWNSCDTEVRNYGEEFLVNSYAQETYFHCVSDVVGKQEIKFEFETVIKSATIPDIEAEKKEELKQKIKELEETILLAKSQIEALKGE